MEANITHPELVAALVKPGDQVLASLTAKDADLWHAATGVMGEATEIMETIIDYADGAELDRANLIEEMGDMEFYLEQYRSNLGLTRDDVFALNEELVLSNDPMCLGGLITVACGNLLDQTKKIVIYRKEIDMATLLSALFRIEGLMIVLRHCLQATYEETVEGNIAKLSVRYAGLKYSDDAAQKRADKQ